MTYSLIDNEDVFEAQLKEQEHKRQKKLAKQERLNRKKILIDEIKSTFDNSHGSHKSSSNQEEILTYKKGSIEWALCLLKANQHSNIGEIKKNYLMLAQQCHPDKNNGETTQEMSDLNQAWEIIKIQYR